MAVSGDPTAQQTLQQARDKLNLRLARLTAAPPQK
jgi:hypothetical protein